MKRGTYWVWGDQERRFVLSGARLNPRWELRCPGRLRTRAMIIGDEVVEAV